MENYPFSLFFILNSQLSILNFHFSISPLRRLCMRFGRYCAAGAAFLSFPLRLSHSSCFVAFLLRRFWGCAPERVWVISIARLRRYRLYTCNLSTSSSMTTLMWRSYLEGGFVLRCFQHLSWPDAATRQCSWRNNRCTGGLSNTVLSY